ncbi:head-tail connector protein [Liquorilactobacillus mali]|uniref:head-tail connector protein n=1 Tax=Liquorilactobacillus mali TaxID=1618 RepID=UPI00264FF716|nr:head-tail connector protein [Liquorilactobacillus mali]MDN7145270.1 head-tail connector protein [Liquorilactobacillus mali]
MAEETPEATTVDLNTLKNSLRIDSATDDTLLSQYILAAQKSIQTAVGSEIDNFYTQDSVLPLYNVATLAIASSLYQHRSALSDTQTYAVDLTSNSIIGQLRGIYDSQVEQDEESDTDG